MADSLETMALCFDSASAPNAMVMENTAGMATGIDATSRTRTNCKIPSASLRPQLSLMTMSV